MSPQSALYIKDKYCISNEAFHELTMVTNLPTSSTVKKLTSTLNSNYDIKNAPNGIVGVLQSLRKRLIFHVTKLERQYREANKELPTTIRVKLTGDGTQIARGFTVVNFAFTILEEDELVCSAKGNHSIGIFKVSENYDDLAAALKDFIEEAKDFEVVTVQGKVHNLQYYLGGDWKFLALVCGLESATSEYACIWCKCPKRQRWDMSLTWSFDSERGGRTTDEIIDKSKLAKSSKNRFNCCRPPLFSFIPMKRVVIDSLHLFLRIADVLINLLIRDLRRLDGIGLTTANCSQSKNLDAYIDFLNNECKIRFRWYTDKESKKVTWRDLTGPEKIKLFDRINITVLFPDLQTKDKLQKLWKDFFALIKTLGKRDCNAIEFGHRSKAWVEVFTSLYQTKDVTPYMHAFAMHVPEFLSLYGNIVMFSQQGLEKLNDITTIHFQHSTNHRESEAYRQILEKGNRIEELFKDVSKYRAAALAKEVGITGALVPPYCHHDGKKI